jgi:hypothetical protein
MEAQGERRYSSYSFTTSALDGVSVTPRPRFNSGERTPGTLCTGGWVGPRAGLDTEARGKILCLYRGSNPDRPVRSQTLYCLSYTGSIPAPVDTYLNFYSEGISWRCGFSDLQVCESCFAIFVLRHCCWQVSPSSWQDARSDVGLSNATFIVGSGA